jgi:hypothetical protein
MEIKIRNIDESIAAQIDTQAKKLEISRQEYLKNVIDRLAISPKLIEAENTFNSIMKQALNVIDQNTYALNQNSQILENLIELIK